MSNVCIDMDLSESPKCSKNLKKAKPFFQHAHYVAASRVKSLNSLHILNWNPDLIGVNKDVQDHLDYMHGNHEVKLCYTPVNKLLQRFKFSFQNMCSLKKHKEDITSNENMQASDVILLAETKLSHRDDSNDYNIKGYVMF